MLSEVGMMPVIGGEDYDESADLGKEIGLLLRAAPEGDRERELNIYRSGSAPPAVEGPLAGLLEEEARSDPAYLEYYYSHVNLNPRLPPPVMSKEDWRFAQRLQGGGAALGGIGDRRKGGGRASGENGEEEERQDVRGGGEWRDKGGDGLIGLSGLALRSGSRHKGLADPFQDNLGHTAQAGHQSKPTSRTLFQNNVDALGVADAQLAHLCNDIPSMECQRISGNGQPTTGVQTIGPSVSQTFASILSASLSRSNTPDPQLVARASSPGLPPVGVKMGSADKKNICSTSFSNSNSFAEPADILAAFSGIDLSRNSIAEEDQFKSKHQEFNDTQKYIFEAEIEKNNVMQNPYVKTTDPGKLNSVQHVAMLSYSDLDKKSGLIDLNKSSFTTDGRFDVPRHYAPSADSYSKVHSATSITSPSDSPSHHQNCDGASSAFTGYGLNGYATIATIPSMLANQLGTGSLPPLFENAAASSVLSHGLDSRALGGLSLGPNAMELQNLNRISNSAAAAGLQMPLVDPLYLQYLRTAEYASQLSPNINNVPIEGSYTGNAYMDLLGFQKAYLGSLLLSQNQYSFPFQSKCGNSSPGFYGSPSFGLGLSYTGSPLSSPLRSSPGGPGSPLRHGDRNMRFHSAVRNSAGGGIGSWNFDGVSNIDDTFGSTLLEEFKSNKSKCLELSDIAGHVVEFSADQYGSRFIQQKLETATIEEKNMVFDEIMPHALSLMTDVFGNYVIQKFFEHGTADQIRELAKQLTGHVLTLSLQMYGCRVIQKAIEVIDVDQQTKMVAELDGHVMRCVRDQNGNHVIQKCIECIPQDAIQFIISSFYDQVVTLSTHPYGCRVIQRVLEHCSDPKTQKIVMDEIMHCVCMLAQDQYGNYVVQHVLEHGELQERSSIIKQLAGQIVQMSQQKFASNVVEKCLSFGNPEERQILVNEMLGTTDENEPLQAMMKDQFANYVVQKVLETCDDQQRELILSRIKVHLNALKKYTYGKHIVARVEKLVAAGERRIGIPNQYPS